MYIRFASPIWLQIQWATLEQKLNGSHKNCDASIHKRPYAYFIWSVALYDASLHRRHNERDGVSNHQPHECVPNRLLMRRSKKTSKPRVIGLCEGNSLVIGQFPAQRASKEKNASIWWRHHDTKWHTCHCFVSGQQVDDRHLTLNAYVGLCDRLFAYRYHFHSRPGLFSKSRLNSI